MKVHFGKREPFRELAYFFLRPEASLKALIRQTVVGKFQMYKHMIGMHLRRLKGSEELMPKVEDFGAMADAIQRANRWPDDFTGIYIAADVPSVVDQLMESYPRKNFIYIAM